MTQFPPDITRTVTLYVRYADPATGQQTNKRILLSGVFWHDNSSSLFAKTGVQIANSVEVYIPYNEEVTGSRYVTPEQWNATAPDALNGLWTVDLKTPPAMVSYESDYEFSWGTSAQVTTEQNQFLVNTPSARTVKDCNVYDFGSPNMRYILLRGG